MQTIPQIRLGYQSIFLVYFCAAFIFEIEITLDWDYSAFLKVEKMSTQGGKLSIRGDSPCQRTDFSPEESRNNSITLIIGPPLPKLKLKLSLGAASQASVSQEPPQTSGKALKSPGKAPVITKPIIPKEQILPEIPATSTVPLPAAQAEEPPKKRRGRRKGSKNKKVPLSNLNLHRDSRRPRKRPLYIVLKKLIQNLKQYDFKCSVRGCMYLTNKKQM